MGYKGSSYVKFRWVSGVGNKYQCRVCFYLGIKNHVCLCGRYNYNLGDVKINKIKMQLFYQKL